MNGEFAGGTPTTRTVAPGQYMVEVSKLGSRSWLRSVKIKAGDSVGIHAELQSLQPKSSRRESAKKLAKMAYVVPAILAVVKTAERPAFAQSGPVPD